MMRKGMRPLGTALICFLFCMAAFAQHTYYVSKSAGSDSNTSGQAQSKNAPWQHLPGMASCSGNCASYSPAPGDTFVLMGCDVWTNVDMPVSWKWSGSSGSRIVIGGEDQTWYNSANCPSGWNRPVWNGEKTAINRSFFNPNAGSSDTHDVTLDNVEMTQYEAETSTDVIQWVGSTSINWTFSNLYIHAWDAPTDNNCVIILGPWGYGSSTNIVFENNVIDGSDRTGTTGQSGVCYAFYTGYYGVKILNNVIRYLPNMFVGSAGGGQQAVEIGGNLIEYGLNSANGVNHCNMIEMQGGTAYIHDNVIRNFYCGGGLTLELGQAANETDYVWNNVIYGLDIGGGNAAPPETGETFSGIQTYFWNNTVVVGSTASNPCLNQESGRHPSAIYVDFQNNHCVTEGSSAVYNFGTEGTLVSTNNLAMSHSTASKDGYTSSESFAYSPTSASSPTVGQGVDLTSSMSSWVPGFPTSDTEYGCSEQTINGVVQAVCPTRTPNARSGAWDIGGYEYNSQDPPPSPPTGLTATVN